MVKIGQLLILPPVTLSTDEVLELAIETCRFNRAKVLYKVAKKEINVPSLALDIATMRRRTSLRCPTLFVLTSDRRMKSFCWPWYLSTVVILCGLPISGLFAQLEYKIELENGNLVIKDEACSLIRFALSLLRN